MAGTGTETSGVVMSQPATTDEAKRERLLDALSQFVRQRPGLEYGNYNDPSLYRSEMRSITRDRHDAERLMAAVRWRTTGIPYAALCDAVRQAYSGRLSWDDARQRLDYCTGQYFPTEYRKAVCAVMASALWDAYRRDLPAGMERSGDAIRAHFRREFGARLQRRWFD